MADRVIEETRGWVQHAVVGLNLCPFAKAPLAKGQIRWVCSDAAEVKALLLHLVDELRLLAQAAPESIETTLLIHPQVLTDFLDYNDFLDLADAALDALGLAGTIQIASFHPQYQFAGTAQADPGNATNRSPYPTLHLLREASVERAVAAFPQAEAIFEVNQRTLEALGADGWATLQARFKPTAST